MWGNDYFNNLLNFNWVLTTSPGGNHQWKPSNPTNPVEAKFMMLTSDIALLHDPLNSYQKIVREFASNLNLLNSVFAHAWYKLTTRDMGPISRCVGNQVPPAQPFQYPLPPPPYASQLPDWTSVRSAIMAIIYPSAASSIIAPDTVNGKPYYGAQLVHLAYASAATFRRTDYLGGANGARIRFSPESTWGVNAGLSSVLQLLQPVKNQFGSGLTWADLIVFAGQVAIEDAAGGKLTLPFCPGRSDALSSDNGAAFLNPPTSLNYSATIDQIEQHLKISGLTANETVALQARPRSGQLMTKLGFHGGTYTTTPNVLSNQYFVTLLNGWDAANWTTVHSPQQEYELGTSAAYKQPVYATPSDLNVIYDQDLQPFAMQYASDNNLFLNTFAAAWTKLVSLDRFNGPTGNLCPQYAPPLPSCLYGSCTYNPNGCVTGTVCKYQSASYSQCVDEAATTTNCIGLNNGGCGSSWGQTCCNPAATCQSGKCVLPYPCA